MSSPSATLRNMVMMTVQKGLERSRINIAVYAVILAQQKDARRGLFQRHAECVLVFAGA